MARRAPATGPCPNCGRTSASAPNFYTHTEVITGPSGAISTRDEVRLEYLCRWCGTRLEAGRPVTVEDVPSL